MSDLRVFVRITRHQCSQAIRQKHCPFNELSLMVFLSRDAMRIRIIPFLEWAHAPVQRTSDTCRSKMKAMRGDHLRLDITMAQPSFDFFPRGWRNWGLHDQPPALPWPYPNGFRQYVDPFCSTNLRHPACFVVLKNPGFEASVRVQMRGIFEQ